MRLRIFALVFFYNISLLYCILPTTSGWDVKTAVLGGEKEVKMLPEKRGFKVRAVSKI